MGMFGRGKTQEERAEVGMQKAADIAAGKGMGGRLAKRFMGAENSARLQDGVDAYRNSQAAATAAASGMAPVSARVTDLRDTGTLMHFDPVVDLTVSLDDGRSVSLRTVVSKVQVPRTGDAVVLFPNSNDPSGFSYGGPAANGV